VSRSSRLVVLVPLLVAVTMSRRSVAAPGAWSNFGPPMPHNQPSTAVGNPPIVVTRGHIYVSDRSGVSEMSLAAPTSWTYVNDPASHDRVGRLVVNALGNPLIGEKGQVVRVWSGSKFREAAWSPPPGSGYTLVAMAVDAANGDIYAAANFNVYKSVDNGLGFGRISDVGTACAGSNGDGKGWVYTIAVAPWRELLVGGESDAIYSSRDGGATWSALPKFAKGGNRYATAPTKDGEILISTAFSNAGNDYFMTYTADGALVPATEGLPTFLLNDQQAVAGQIVYLDSGENFVVARFRTDKAVHCLKWDGKSWMTIESLPDGPGAGLLSNSFGTDGTNLYVGTASGQIKRWTPAAKLPFTVSAGANQSVAVGAAASLTGTVSAAGKYTYRWTARGSKAVSFANAAAATTTATFSQPGDYAVNVKATDARGVTAGATILIHVSNSAGRRR
jgi:hypothetical protein